MVLPQARQKASLTPSTSSFRRAQMSAPDNAVIYKGTRLHYDRLCVAVRQTAQPHSPTSAQLEALAELQACRAQIASPLDPKNEPPPSQQDRSRLTSSSGINVLINSDTTSPDSDPIPIRLGSDLVSVAIALSDELHINEVDAAILLYDARARAARRSDHDVVAAAKEVFIARRQESLLYLQEIIRAGLNHADEIQQVDTFMSALLKERDLLLTDHHVFQNIVDRLSDALQVLSDPQRAAFQRLTASEERLLLAETLFLLAYTIQLNSTEANALYSLLRRTQQACQTFCNSDGSSAQKVAQPFNFSTVTDTRFRPTAVDVVRLKSVRNLIFLAWTTALDRSRYHNIYNPRTGQTGVNELLKDASFISSTNRAPRLVDGEEDTIAAVGPILAAAELSGAIFRLAVARPDEEEAVTTFLRASAYGNAFDYLSEELIQWIRCGAGSLSPDTDLYADVVEDLALDIAEAPRLVAALIQFTQNETYELTANVALESLRSMSTGRGAEKPSLNPSLASPDSRRIVEEHSVSRGSFANAGSMRPPTHPRSRRGSRMAMHRSPTDEASGALRVKMEDNLQSSHQGKGMGNLNETNMSSAASLVSVLARFVARAVSMAPAKLQCDSVGGGMRYWVGIGQSSIGFIPRIGDAVIDMWDTAMRNANAPGAVGSAFRQTLQGFLLLLKTTSARQGSPAHAAASLKYLRHGGHPVASLERATGAVSYIAESFSVSSSDIQLDDAETKALCGILDVIATAAEALELHGGVMPILEDSGRDLASRLSSFVILSIPLQLRESAIKCLSALNYSRTVPVLLETLCIDRCTVLRHWARVEEAPSKSFSVTTSIMGLVKRCIDGTDSCSEKTMESVAACYIIDEVLSFWNRRAYSVTAQRWEVLATASEILVKLLAKNPSGSVSQQIATSLLQPAPGTGSASYAFQTLCLAVGLVSREEQIFAEYRKSWGMTFESSRMISGRDLLTQIVRVGQGECFRWMRKAVFHSSRLLSLLLMVSPGRLSRSGMVTASAVDLLAGEPDCLTSASSLVYSPDGFDPVLSRAGYGLHLSATILNMLGKAAQGSGVIASILTKDVPDSSGSASQFRSSLSRILLDAPSSTGQPSAESVSGTKGTGDHISFEDPVLHSVLRIVEACLGPDGCAAPGMFLLGFPTDTFGPRNATEHGVLGSLIELVAGANPYQLFDDPCRATAATFLERLVSHTAKNTSSAVQEHIRSISLADPTIRGGGFADEMLLRMIEDMQQKDIVLTNELDWSSFATLLSACMKLSALQVRLFPQHEKGISETAAFTQDPIYGAQSDSYLSGTSSNLPSPHALLELLSRAADFGDQSNVNDAFVAWSKLIGIRLSVHTEGKGYANESVLFDVTMKLLSALSSGSRGSGLETLVVMNHGEAACATIMDCVTKLAKCYEAKGLENTQTATEHQFLSIIDGACRGLAALSQAGSRSERARTFLYGTLLSCCLLRRADVSTNFLSRALCRSSSDMGAVGVDTLIDVACSDALLGNSNASKSSAITLISRLVACEPSRTLQALAAQNRFRRIVTTAFSDMIDSSTYEHGDSHFQKDRIEGGRSAAVVRAVLSLIHAISVTATGGRLLADASCIEALAQVLATYESGSAWKHIRKPDSPYFTPVQLEIPLDVRQVPHTGGSGPDALETWQSALFTSLTGALATAVRCGGENVVEDVVYAINKGHSVFLDILRSLHLPDEAELKAVCALGMTLSRIPPHLLSAAVTCSQLRANLACIIGRILPAVTKAQRLGESGSFLSAGINLKTPSTARAARRMRTVHPEGGSLYERDIVRARASALRNIFSTLIQRNALPFLFAPTLAVARSEDQVTIPDQSYPSGNLGEVLRIAQAMLREYNRSTNESAHLGRQAVGDARPSISATTETELSRFCEEQYGIRPEALDQSQITDCLKKESVASRRHAAVCMRVLEMALIILREYIFNAVDTARGKPLSRGDNRDIGNGTRSMRWREMSVNSASSLLADANISIIPFCKDVENVQDGVGDNVGTFSRQVCRQIRAACPT